MNEEYAKKMLAEEGWLDIHVQEDDPHTFYPEHTHEEDVAHIVLTGSMILMMGRQAKIVKEGQRVDVPAHAVHSAKIGPDGCRYIIGRKKLAH